MKNRILSLLLSCALLLGLFPLGLFSAAAAESVAYPVEGGNIYFDKETGTITDCDVSVTAADIPGEIDGVAVTSIGVSAFEDCDSLTSVTFPSNVTRIGDSAFRDCNSLTSVTIPDSVTSIGSSAFRNCDDLMSVVIPDSVTSIGSYAFYSCNSLTSVTIPDSVTSIEESLFRFCDNLESVTIPDSVTSIGSSAFGNCYSLESVTIPDSVTSIGSYAFDYCSSMTSITIMNPDCSIYSNRSTLGGAVIFGYPDSTAESYANEYGKTFIGHIYENGECTICGESAGLSGTCGESIQWSLNPETGEMTISGTGVMPNYGNNTSNAAPWYIYRRLIKEVVIEDGILSIGSYAFYYCDRMEGVTIPDSVMSIGQYAFFFCGYLTSVTIPYGVTSIEEYLFDYCYSLTSVVIPDSVTSIGNGAFSDCDNLTSLTIPDSVTSIGSSAFRDCGRLTSVTIPDSVTSIRGSAFSNCDSLTSVTIPDSVTSIGDYAFYSCNNLTGIWVDEANENYSSDENGVLFNKDKTTLIQCPGGYSGSYAIPDSVTSIEESAFRDCASLESVTIPDSVTSIGSYAFEDCESLTSVTIPDSVTSIGDYAFYSCASLESVTIPDSVTSIGSSAFRDCDSLTSVAIGDGVRSIGQFASSECYSLMDIGDQVSSACERLTSVKSGNSVTSIGASAFENCDSLQSVVIGSNVTSIGNTAFADCGNLRAVYFLGNAPTLGTNVFDVYDIETNTYQSISDLTVYYIEGREGWTSPPWNDYPTATWVPEHECSYAAVVTAPTCTEEGFTTYTCDFCGDSYTADEVAALGHSYIYKDNGDDHIVTCANGCDYSATETHNFVDGTCICGAVEGTDPYLDTSLVFMTQSLNLDSSILSQFILNPKSASGYDSFYVAFKHIDADGNVTETTSEGVAYYTYKVFEIASAAKEMSDTIEVTLYAQKDGVWYHGETISWILRDELTRALRASTKDTYKTLAATILNYGAAAQFYFSYNTGDLANSLLTAEELAYAKTTPNTLADNSSTVGSANGVTSMGTTLGLEGAIQMQFVFKASGLTPANLEARISYTIDGTATTDTIDGSEFGVMSSYITVVYDKLAAKDLRTVVTVGIYDKATGNLLSPEVSYSAESFCYQKLNAADTANGTHAMCTSIMCYIDAAADYFE